jgi:hypothetical protein
MRRVAWGLAFIVLGSAFSVLADCGCAQGAEPECYVTFRTNELVSFSAVFPLEFFTAHSTTETPFILGWGIEAAGGILIRSVSFSDVAGWWQDFVWDLADDSGNEVEPGFYRVLVLTTAGVVSADIRLVSCCTPCLACWSCCLCTTCPRAGHGSCPAPCGEAYLELDVAATKSCCVFSSLLFGG